MLDFITTPLTYGFMQRGLLAALLVGVICAVIGCYIVLRSMAFLGDAMAHAILPGVAVAYMVNGNLLAGGLVASIAVALGIGFFSRGGAIKEDTAIGIIFSAALSLGVALISSMQSYASDLTHIMFGNLLGVSSGDLVLTAVLGIVILLAIFLLYKEFMVVSFDPVLASTLHYPVNLLQNLMLVLIAVTIVISLQTVGVGLVTALLITPAATAQLLTRRLPAMMMVSAACGAFSAVAGLYLSYYVNIASGSAIVLICTLLFILAFLFSPRRGLVIRFFRKS
ncbi:MAG: metal ABC transporter permease [Chloroflexi bacterium]|nr:metal ABC transporter permease [Chloroflexota bacterium]